MSAANSALQEVFVLLRSTATSRMLQSVIDDVETAGGRILISFPPRVLIALIEQPAVFQFHPEVQNVITAKIDETSLHDLDDTVSQAIVVWNSRFEPTTTEDLGRGLSWDAPGRLPPDPPPDVRDMLTRREQNYHEHSEDGGE